MLRVLRHGDRHDAKDVTVAVRFEGDFEAAFRDGNPSGVLPGEALTNLVHRVAREQEHSEIETLGLAICERVLAQHPQIGRARVDLIEQPWARVQAGGKLQDQVFSPAGLERRTASVTSNASRIAVSAGLENLIVLRTSGLASGDAGADVEDGTRDGLPPLLVGTLSAIWAYDSGDIPFAACRQGVRAAVIDTFAWHASRSLQHTLYAMADVILATFEGIALVTLTLQERPYRPVDLLEFSMERDAVFVARDEPVGLVEVTVERQARR